MDTTTNETERHTYRGWSVTPLTNVDGERTGRWAARAPMSQDPANLRRRTFDTVTEAHAYIDTEVS